MSNFPFKERKIDNLLKRQLQIRKPFGFVRPVLPAQVKPLGIELSTGLPWLRISLGSWASQRVSIYLSSQAPVHILRRGYRKDKLLVPVGF